MKPQATIFPYPGKKTKLLKNILPLIPDHRRYVEPFAGGLAVFCHKPPSKVEVVNDINQDLVSFLRYVRHHKDALLETLKHYHHSRDDFKSLRDSQPQTDLQRAVKFFICQWGSFGGIGRTWGRSSNSFSGFSYDDTLDRIEALSKRLRGVYIENQDYEKVISFWDSPETFIYCDPPYVSCQKTAYPPFSEIEMCRLRDALENAQGQWLLSCDNSETCRSVFEDHYFTELSITYSVNKNHGTRASELLVMSPDVATTHESIAA